MRVFNSKTHKYHTNFRTIFSVFFCKCHQHFKLYYLPSHYPLCHFTESVSEKIQLKIWHPSLQDSFYLQAFMFSYVIFLLSKHLLSLHTSLLYLVLKVCLSLHVHSSAVKICGSLFEWNLQTCRGGDVCSLDRKLASKILIN